MIIIVGTKETMINIVSIIIVIILENKKIRVRLQLVSEVWMRLKIAMDPENDLLEPPADKAGPFGDLDSDYDDDDRRELISHYANEKYLSKWEEVDDEESQQEPSSTLHVHIPNSSNNDSQ